MEYMYAAGRLGIKLVSDSATRVLLYGEGLPIGATYATGVLRHQLIGMLPVLSFLFLFVCM